MTKIFCDQRSINARAILAELDADFVDDPAQADLIWLRGGHSHLRSYLYPQQLLNYIPGEGTLGEKGHLAQHLKAFDRTQQLFDFSLRDFYPQTYTLYDEAECRAFFAQLPATDVEENLWILKPVDLSKGIGVRIMWQFDALRQLYEPRDDDEIFPEIQEYVIQRYIKNPLLLHERKSEIRIYLLIACLDPLLVLLYREGTVRLNSQPFRLGDFENTLIHVTNVYQQKRHPDYDPELVLKWDFDDLQSYLVNELKRADENFIEEQLRPQLRNILKFVLQAVLQRLQKPNASGLGFGLYGVDLILDESLRPWLTEVQLGPGLSFDDPVKERIIPNMVREAARIVLEIQQRKRRRDALTRLENVSTFEWLINDA